MTCFSRTGSWWQDPHQGASQPLSTPLSPLRRQLLTTKRPVAGPPAARAVWPRGTQGRGTRSSVLAQPQRWGSLGGRTAQPRPAVQAAPHPGRPPRGCPSWCPQSQEEDKFCGTTQVLVGTRGLGPQRRAGATGLGGRRPDLRQEDPGGARQPLREPQEQSQGQCDPRGQQQRHRLGGIPVPSSPEASGSSGKGTIKPQA